MQRLALGWVGTRWGRQWTVHILVRVIGKASAGLVEMEGDVGGWWLDGQQSVEEEWWMAYLCLRKYEKYEHPL